MAQLSHTQCPNSTLPRLQKDQNHILTAFNTIVSCLHSFPFPPMPTAVELCKLLADSSETANDDICRTRPMPSCDGRKDVPAVLEALQRGRLEEITVLLTTLLQDDKRAKKGRQYSTRAQRECMASLREMAEDMQQFLEVNSGMTKNRAVVPPNCYRGDQTTIAEIAMTFYDLLRQGNPNARQRVVTLQAQSGLVLSPLMKAVLSKSQQS